ncbi:MAG: glycosyltransferase [Clostridia bacterium]|nr:glycosyltransferase [Clostridia bacterium]
MLKLLIITALYTGHGHKSISDALEERLQTYPDLDVLTIDGFDLMDKVMQVCAEKTYGPITRLPGKTWQFNYAMGVKFKGPVQTAVASMIRHRFQSLIEEYRPDCILSVHPVFLGCICSLLEEMGLDIPLIAHEADLIDIAPFWFDPRIHMVLAPSKESYDSSLQGGVLPERLRQVGFPVRSRFMGKRRENYMPNRPVTITVMSGSEGSGVIRVVTRELLRGTDAKVTVICGRNKALRAKLKKAFTKEYYGRVNVMGFVENIQDIMLDSDILVMRASPNSVMEAVALNIPAILFGQLAGQELLNPDMMQSHGIAAYCPDTSRLARLIRDMLKNNGEAMERMRRAQREYMPGDDAKDTAELFYNEVKRIHEKRGAVE